ncbi:DUF3857 domain-containing protein [Stenotrophomonas sp. MH181796]|uniref:DUF3857 domain-containing protein n=1 Tax=Stenotrophomonas sp. MH181796 TaxID=2339228 RepID=UPI00129C30A3|nr:DUF3857 domain-containing protein [Stenotrophomonas sp. MH181796]MRI43460.1 DUF3857 domain-containing protein [Stenotrophomonas sp. MH181796]
MFGFELMTRSRSTMGVSVFTFTKARSLTFSHPSAAGRPNVLAIGLGLALLSPVLSAAPLAGEEGGQEDVEVLRSHRTKEFRADGSTVSMDERVLLLHTQAAVEAMSQESIDYIEGRQSVEVLEAYVLDPAGQRHDVPKESIYTQQQQAGAAPASHADGKARVIVYPRLSRGATIVLKTRFTQIKPLFEGYAGLMEVFSPYTTVRDARVTIIAPESIAMKVRLRDAGGLDHSRADGMEKWVWEHRNQTPLAKPSAQPPEGSFGPAILASNFAEWGQVGRAYHIKAAEAASVTPAITALAERLTEGLQEPHDQAAALHRWVTANIRYVAVYLSNGGLEPNAASLVLDRQYGDCKDKVALLQALLAAKGIESTPVLVGMRTGPVLPALPVVGHFDHVILYVPALDLYTDPTAEFSRFGELPGSVRGRPVVHAADGRLGRTPPLETSSNRQTSYTEYRYAGDGNVIASTRFDPGAEQESHMRGAIAGLPAREQVAVVARMIVDAGMEGVGRMSFDAQPQDLTKPLNFSVTVNALQNLDFSRSGSSALPQAFALKSIRDAVLETPKPENTAPFWCLPKLREERYSMHFPATVKIMEIPEDSTYTNAAGRYSVQWRQKDQTVIADHRLEEYAVRGSEALCEAEDYPAFRALFQQVRRAFEARIQFAPR